NMRMNINTAGLAEGLGLADALGLDLRVVAEVFSQTGANSRVLETDGPDMLDREHSTFFSAAHAAKDSGIALALAQQQGLHLPLLEGSKAQYDQMIRVGLGEIDKSGISELTFRSRRPLLSERSGLADHGRYSPTGTYLVGRATDCRTVSRTLPLGWLTRLSSLSLGGVFRPSF